MTDRFLFRGKTKDNGNWITGDLAHFGDETWIFLSTEDITKCYHIDPATVGQCTSLRDKNGNLIFEGDIVVIYDTERGEVKWFKSGCCFIIDMHVKWDFVNDPPDIEIIGNIYDNPELKNEV